MRPSESPPGTRLANGGESFYWEGRGKGNNKRAGGGQRERGGEKSAPFPIQG